MSDTPPHRINPICAIAGRQLSANPLVAILTHWAGVLSSEGDVMSEVLDYVKIAEEGRHVHIGALLFPSSGRVEVPV